MTAGTNIYNPQNLGTVLVLLVLTVSKNPLH